MVLQNLRTSLKTFS